MNPMPDESGFVREVLPVFVHEAQEQIETIEQLLLQLEDEPADRELLDALFRCAHTVKGSAGIFGLDAVVGFTHHVETLLDRLRAGQVALSPELSTLLLRCNDQIRALVAAALDAQPEAAEAAARREQLVALLCEAAGEDLQAGAPAGLAVVIAGPEQPEPLAQAQPGATRRWHLSVQFGVDTFRNGMDPLAILNYLRRLGDIPALVCDTSGVPALEPLDPESCHLGFEFGLLTTAARSEIEAAFEFVREDARLNLLAPEAGLSEFVALIEALPEQPRLGDMLLSVGAITHAQLQQALQAQAQARASAGQAAPLGAILQSQSGVSPQVVEAALQKQSRQRQGAADERFIRVHAERLDAVIDLLGELVTASAGGLLRARQCRQRELVEANEHISALVEEIRNATLQLRMVPIGETFSRFRRVVRDTAAELGKEVTLEIVGAETELDKSVVERIADPLMHLVRNALDHGLERPERRSELGKPAQGRLTLAASHEAGTVLIRIRDDGRGIDRERVLQRAWERGLLEDGHRPADAEILKLIFEPGFSTAEQITNLSGRGVGMDVVRRNIEALRGTVSLHSQPGQGSCIEIRLPLTLAIIDGFLVGVGRSKFIFPLEAVLEVIEAREPPAQGRTRGLVELRGHVLPVLSLRNLYGLGASASDRSSVVVIQAGSQRYGVWVDQVLGQHQTVIKPLSQIFRSLRGMAGSSILGNGEIALIVDVNTLCQLAAQEGLAGPGRSETQPNPALQGLSA